MSETHINVYFQNVTDAEQALAIAKGNLEYAKNELQAKKLEVGYEEEEPKKAHKPTVKRTATKNTKKATPKKIADPKPSGFLGRDFAPKTDTKK